MEVKDLTQIIPGAYFTGNIERMTTYEKVPPSLLVKRAENPSPMISGVSRPFSSI